MKARAIVMIDEGKRKFWRDVRAPEYWLLVVSAVAATCGVPWWVVIPLGMAGLSIFALPKDVALWPRAQEVGAQGVWWRTVALAIFNAFAATGVAYLLGRIVRWMWW